MGSLLSAENISEEIRLQIAWYRIFLILSLFLPLYFQSTLIFQVFHLRCISSYP